MDTQSSDAVTAADSAEHRLAALLGWLKSVNYRFVTPTPATHRIVFDRPPPPVPSLRDILGWSRPFDLACIPAAWRDALTAAQVLAAEDGGVRATVRVSNLGPDLFVHSRFPTSEADAVFFGPDTYRFARFLRSELQGRGRVRTAVDLGAGSGAGAVAAFRAAEIDRLILLDVNGVALSLARSNLAAAGIGAEFRLGDGLAPLHERVDLIIANPPFIADDGGRVYRDGGDMHGARLSLDWALAGAERLAPGGRMLLYTGSAILEGDDPLRDALSRRLEGDRFDLRYEELDPDIFGDELRSSGYADVERIAAVGAAITARF